MINYILSHNFCSSKELRRFNKPVAAGNENVTVIFILVSSPL